MAALPRLILRGLRDMGLRPWSEFLAVASIGLVAFLAGALLLGARAMDGLIRSAHGEVAFQVYWRIDADPAEVARAWTELDRWPGRLSLVTFTPAQALDVLASDLGPETTVGAPTKPANPASPASPSGQPDVPAAPPAPTLPLASLKGRNPLPATALLNLAAPDDDTAWPAWLETTLARLHGLPSVASVHHDPMRADLSRSWLRMVRIGLPVFLAFLGLVAGFVAAGTVRLATLGRAEEIAVLRLVGATPWYVRLPHLVHGATLGALSGGMAVGLLWVCLNGLAGLGDFGNFGSFGNIGDLGGLADPARLKDVLHFLPLWIKIEPLPWDQAAALVGALFLIGAAASWTAGRE